MGRRRRKKITIERVKITGIADKGRGVGRDEEGRVLFVEQVAPGDVVDVLVLRKKQAYLMGRPIHTHHFSVERVPAFCQHYEVCGGCKWQHITYQAQMKYKFQVVRDALERIAKVEVEKLLPIIPAESTTYYRNKMEFTFSNKKWLTKEEIANGDTNFEDVLGFHKAGAFDKIVDVKHCFLQEDPSNTLRNGIKALAIKQELSFYDIKQNEGMMRHILIRITKLEEVLVIFSFHYDEKDKIFPFMDKVLAQFPQITSMVYCINPKVNDYILDLDMITYYGKGYVEEQLGHLRFRIGPKSFFQTNTQQAKVLYDKVVEFADLKGTENVYDLYTGIGSIAQYIAKDAKQVVGIEEIEDAIKDAYINAKLNNIDNCVFYAGSVRTILTDDFAQKHGKPDLLITDPPRVGMHPKVIPILLQLEAPRMVYVSCNPATQARDIHLLSEKYKVLKVQAVDMFPHTHHIESVALLELRDEPSMS